MSCTEKDQAKWNMLVIERVKKRAEDTTEELIGRNLDLLCAASGKWPAEQIQKSEAIQRKIFGI